MHYNVAGFEWDSGNRDKCRKHGVSCVEIEELFANVPSVYPDPAHSVTEERLRAIGQTYHKRYVFVVFTLRENESGETLIRPISARYMHDKEVRHYERQQQQ